MFSSWLFRWVDKEVARDIFFRRQAVVEAETCPSLPPNHANRLRVFYKRTQTKPIIIKPLYLNRRKPGQPWYFSSDKWYFRPPELTVDNCYTFLALPTYILWNKTVLRHLLYIWWKPRSDEGVGWHIWILWIILMNSNFVNVFSVYATFIFKLYNTSVLIYWIYYVFMLKQTPLHIILPFTSSYYHAYCLSFS